MPASPGARFFADEIHWGGERHWLVTRAVLKALAARPQFRGRLDPAAAGAAGPPAAELAGLLELHRQAILFYAADRLGEVRGFSPRALRWLEGARTLNPAPFAGADALAEAAGRVASSFDNRRPGLYRPARAAEPVPRAALTAHLAWLDLEGGRCQRAADEFAAALKEPRPDPTLRLARAAALAVCGRDADARAELDAARAASLGREADAVAGAVLKARRQALDNRE